MSVFDEKRVELERHEFMMGVERGRLAVALDLLTDALILVGSMGCIAPPRAIPPSRRLIYSRAGRHGWSQGADPVGDGGVAKRQGTGNRE